MATKADFPVESSQSVYNARVSLDSRGSPVLLYEAGRRQGIMVPRVGNMRGILAAGLFLLAIGVSAADELETIDGARIAGTLETISATGEVGGAGIPADTRLDSLRLISRAVKAAPVKAKYVVETHGDGRLLVDSVSLADDRFAIVLSGGKEMMLPLDAVRCVRFEPDLAMNSFKEALARPSADVDRIFVKVDKQIDTIKGLIVALDAKELSFEFEKETRKLPRERLHGIVLAQAGEAKSQPATVQLVNGSRVAGKVASLNDGELQLELPGGAKAQLPFDSVERIELRSQRVAYLSDADPLEVREETILTAARPWQRDRSVSGRTLTLGNRVYPRGIGVHAKSELEFEVPAGFDLFVATVGIDASVQGKGDCEFEVLGNNRSLWSQRIKGTDAPQPIRVELKGVKRLVLRVNAGADFDLGDHANWCDARFLKSK